MSIPLQKEQVVPADEAPVSIAPEPVTRGLPIEDQGMEAYLQETSAWEADRWAEMAHSRRRAWQVAAAAGLLAALSILAVVGLTPLKTVEPYVMLVDQASGYTKIIRRYNDIPVTDLAARAAVVEFVEAYHAYDYGLIQRQHDFVQTYSADIVFNEYLASLGAGDRRIDRRLQNKSRVYVDITSVFHAPGATVATVRFRMRQVGQQGESEREESWIANVKWWFPKAEATGEQQALDNPWGMQIITYQVEPEMGP